MNGLNLLLVENYISTLTFGGSYQATEIMIVVWKM